MRVLQNLKTKLEDEIAKLTPEARVQKWVEDRVQQAIELLNDGQICTRF
jgi:hypothetical protein